ncbi:MAG: bifunctional phosphoribosyl-AMP cyclohydrolase/phosphoribosyl-ATP diphosphatase HisIE [Saprospiraceae bacterium]|nr:bifunctional phosphoribosyl-AMP cyclohydrolase/phosphoribosyl-ATP diphosphatase HisIE [Saprospiraceae bacterium]
MTPDFSKSSLIPAIIQDANTGAVLMLGYMNSEALEQTQATGRVTFFSRSKQRLWTKGETSGHFLNVKDIKLDCDNDALLIKAEPVGPVCHTGADTCWNEKNETSSFLFALEKVIQSRKGASPESSYTASLFASGMPKMAQKVGEEAVETVIEALGGTDERLLSESADLLYHLLVLLSARGLSLGDVEEVLRGRHGG